MKFFESYSEHAYSALRIMAGAMFSFHGAQKVLGFMAEQQPPIGSQLWIGGVIELVGGLMIMTGLQAVWAAFVASGQMAVAYFQFHWKFQFGRSSFPRSTTESLLSCTASSFSTSRRREAGSSRLTACFAGRKPKRRRLKADGRCPSDRLKAEALKIDGAEVP